MAQHAVLVDARLVRERIAADHRLVALHRHADQALQQLRGGDDAWGVDVGIDVVERTAHLQCHGDFFQRAVAGALADTVDGALDLPCAAFDRRQRVGHRQAQIVVAVRAEDHGIGTFHAGDQAREHAADLSGVVKPTVSGRLIVVAPAAIATRATSARKSSSVRVASSAENSMSSI